MREGTEMFKYITEQQLDEIVKLSMEHKIFRAEQKQAGNDIYESPATEALGRIFESIGYKGWYEIWLLYVLSFPERKDKKIDWLKCRKDAWDRVNTMVRDSQHRGRDVEYSMIVHLPYDTFVKEALENVQNDNKIKEKTEELARSEREIFAEYESETENRESFFYDTVLEKAVSYIECLVDNDPKNALVTRLATALNKTKDIN
jgi:hypothetical protein